MAVDGVSIPGLGKTTINNIYNIGVSGIGITGQSLISGNVTFIPSGEVRMEYSGNNIVIGAPTVAEGIVGLLTGQGNVFVRNNTLISGSGVPRNVVLIESLNDFPSPVSNNISLEADKIYQFGGIVNIGNNRLTLSNNSILMGKSFKVDGLLSNWTGYVLNSINKSHNIENLLLSSPSGQLFNITSTGSNRITIQNNQMSGCSGLGIMSGFNTLTLVDNRAQENQNGLNIYGPGDSLRIINNRFSNGLPATYTGLAIYSGINLLYNSIFIGGNVFNITSSGTQTALFLQSGITNTGILDGNLFVGSGNFMSGGVLKSHIEWNFQGNNIGDSISRSEIYVTGNVAVTIINSANVFVRASGYSATGVVNERFVMSNSGEVKYIGRAIKEAIVICNGDIATAGGAKVLGVGFLKNDVSVGGVVTTIRTDSNPLGFAIITSMVLQTNDRVALAVQNQTDALDIVVGDYNFIIF